MMLTPNQLLHQQKRFRHKINLKKPRPLHYMRALMDRFLTPYYPDKNKDKTYIDVCENVTTEKLVVEPHPYELLIAREVRAKFDNSKMVAFLHKNSETENTIFDFKVLLKKKDMEAKYYGPRIMAAMLKDSPYEAIKPLLCTPFFFLVFSPENNVAYLRQVLKKFPKLVLMAGILEHRLLHLDDFVRYGTTDLTSERAVLVQTLQTAAGSNLNRQLTHHQTTLVTRLRQIGTSEASTESCGSEPSVPV